jgi:hypothetical protein
LDEASLDLAGAAGTAVPEFRKRGWAFHPKVQRLLEKMMANVARVE